MPLAILGPIPCLLTQAILSALEHPLGTPVWVCTNGHTQDRDPLTGGDASTQLLNNRGGVFTGSEWGICGAPIEGKRAPRGLF